MSREMKLCKSCSKEIGASAKYCPGCRAKNKKPIYKRVWFWVVAIIIVIGATDSSDSGKIEPVQEVSQNSSDNSVAENKPKDTVQTENKVPSEYKSALKRAKLYSDVAHLSKVALYDQLISEDGGNFPAEAAQYAVDNLEVDWKENALKKAKLYQDVAMMSSSDIYDQLISEAERYTPEEAQYAIDNLE